MPQMNRHDRRSTWNQDSHEVNTGAHRTGVVGGNIHTINVPIPDPQLATENPAMVFKFPESRFPDGATVTDCGIAISAASAGYSIDFQKAATVGGALTTIETVATVGAATEAEDDGTIDNPDIDANDILYINLPSTIMTKTLVWVTIEIGS